MSAPFSMARTVGVTMSGAPPRRRATTSEGIPLTFLWKEAVALTAIIGAQCGPSYVGALTIALLTLWALRSNRCAMQALSILVLIVFLNPGLVSSQPLVSSAKWVLVFAAGSGIAVRTLRRTHVPTWFLWLAMYGAMVLALSLLVSSSPELSFFKLLAYVVGATGAVLAFERPETDIGYCLDWFYTLYATVVLLGLPLLFHPLGYVAKHTLFQGILSHPQAFAVYLAPMTTFLVARAITSRGISVFTIAVTIGGVVSLLASGSRTGVLAVILGLLVTVLVVVFSRLSAIRLNRRNIVTAVILLPLIMLALLVSSETLTNRALRFFAKQTTSGQRVSLEDASQFLQSRTGQWDSFIQVFSKYPLTGVGFGVRADADDMSVDRAGPLGLPVSAPNEAGFLPLAILGQTGLIGGILILPFMVALFLPIVKWGHLAIVSLACGAFFVNFGEMVFFSIGGLGLQIWLLIGLCRGWSMRSCRGEQQCA